MTFDSYSSSDPISRMYAQATENTAAEQEALSQQQSQPPKASGFLSDLVGDRKERTLAGAVVGRVRDAFSGELTEQEKVKRAEGNDFVGTIAADTVAMMSKRAMVGGLARAALMADTKGDARDFALGFVKDGLEGVGLNYIGKIAQPGSRAYNFVGNRFGIGLKQEVTLHAGTGALFGALKAGSDPNAWRDQNGHFSFQSGFNNLTDWKKIGTATISGAVINVPAGMIGMRLAKSSTLSVANRTGSETFGRVTGGVISGAGSGGVFGGLDGVIQGKSLAEIGHSTWDGMLVGAAHKPNGSPWQSRTAFKDVTDGLSSTAMIGEKHIYVRDLYKGGSPGGSADGNIYVTEETTWYECHSVRNMDHQDGLSRGLQDNFSFERYKMFGSAHPEICMFVLGDGAVRAIRRNIDRSILRMLGDRRDGEVIPNFD